MIPKHLFVAFLCSFQVIFISASSPWTMMNVNKGTLRTTYANPQVPSENTPEALIALINPAKLANDHKDVDVATLTEYLIVNRVHFFDVAEAAAAAAAVVPVVPQVQSPPSGKKGRNSKAPAAAAVIQAPVRAPVNYNDLTALHTDAIQNGLSALYEDITAAHFVKQLPGFLETFCRRLYGIVPEGKTLDHPLLDQIKAFKLSFQNGKVMIYIYLAFDDSTDRNLQIRLRFDSQISSMFPYFNVALNEQTVRGWNSISEKLSEMGDVDIVSMHPSNNKPVKITEPVVTTNQPQPTASKKKNNKKNEVIAPVVLTPEQQAEYERRSAALIAEFEKEDTRKKAQAASKKNGAAGGGGATKTISPTSTAASKKEAEEKERKKEQQRALELERELERENERAKELQEQLERDERQAEFVRGEEEKARRAEAARQIEAQEKAAALQREVQEKAAAHQAQLALERQEREKARQAEAERQAQAERQAALDRQERKRQDKIRSDEARARRLEAAGQERTRLAAVAREEQQREANLEKERLAKIEQDRKNEQERLAKIAEARKIEQDRKIAEARKIEQDRKNEAARQQREHEQREQECQRLEQERQQHEQREQREQREQERKKNEERDRIAQLEARLLASEAENRRIIQELESLRNFRAPVTSTSSLSSPSSSNDSRASPQVTVTSPDYSVSSRSSIGAPPGLSAVAINRAHESSYGTPHYFGPDANLNPQAQAFVPHSLTVETDFRSPLGSGRQQANSFGSQHSDSSLGYPSAYMQGHSLFSPAPLDPLYSLNSGMSGMVSGYESSNRPISTAFDFSLDTSFAQIQQQAQQQIPSPAGSISPLPLGAFDSEPESKRRSNGQYSLF